MVTTESLTIDQKQETDMEHPLMNRQGSPVQLMASFDRADWKTPPNADKPQISETRLNQETTLALRILVVDDTDSIRKVCGELLRTTGFMVSEAASLAQARELLKRQTVDLMFLDLRLQGEDGLTLLEEVTALHPETDTVVMTAYATISSAVEAMRVGASDYLTKPFTLKDLVGAVDRAKQRKGTALESRQLQEQLRSQEGTNSLIGRSPETDKLYRLISKVAISTHPVLISGETGTGKTLVAQMVHASGEHAKRPFCQVDCGSLASSSVEKELFGYVKGAFVGAKCKTAGMLGSATGGTVFLEEIGGLSLELQAKLMRALQSKEFQPIGSALSVPVTTRVLASTNQDLMLMVERGQFRKDLYFRLNVVNIRVPALRERPADIAMIAAHILKATQKTSAVAYTFSDEALRLVISYDWPGNMRELEHAIQGACILSSKFTLQVGDFPSQLQEFYLRSQAEAEVLKLAKTAQEKQNPLATPSDARSSSSKVFSLAQLEKQNILATISEVEGDKIMAAKLLGIGKTTLYRKLKEYAVIDGVA